MIQFEFIPVFSGSTDTVIFSDIRNQFTESFLKLGGAEFLDQSLNRTLPLALFVISGGTEFKIQELVEKRKAFYPSEPILLIAHPGNNSLAASLETLAKLQQDGQKGKIIYFSNPEDKKAMAGLLEAIRFAGVFHAMQKAKIALVGQPSDWLVASQPTAEAIKTTWGPEVAPISMEKLRSQMSKTDAEAKMPKLEKLIDQAETIEGPQTKDFKDSLTIYSALADLVKEQKLNALSLRCFDLVQDEKATGCFALAQLNEEGIIAGCEGDLVSTLTMLWVQELVGTTAWMANPAKIDLEQNSMWLAHCTIAPCLIKSYDLLTHFETDLGLGIRGHLEKSPCTLIRIGGKNLDKIWLAEGSVLQSGNAANLCRTQALIKLDKPDKLKEMMNNPLGNHIVFIKGKHALQLQDWWDIFIAK
jgi:L-fucose isomerase-like protein